jgi:hypothetical protein
LGYKLLEHVDHIACRDQLSARNGQALTGILI